MNFDLCMDCSATTRLQVFSGHLQSSPGPQTSSVRMSKSPITTHVLDTARGIPAAGLPITLSYKSPQSNAWTTVGSGITNQDGRCSSLLSSAQLELGTYRVHFDTSVYFKLHNEQEPFYPYVEVVFNLNDSAQHYHIPLLLSPYAYSTYRGS